MKIVNVMNFLRSVDPRSYESESLIAFHSRSGVCDPEAGKGLTGKEYEDARVNEAKKGLLETARLQLELAKEMKIPTTFLLQYDTLCDEKYVEMFKSVPDFIEIGLWYEVVKYLADAANVPYNSKHGWVWDWHIEPGFSMSYEPLDREKLADEAMRKFKETFGYYPKTFGSWLIDTHTVNYLADNYDLDAFCICRDQVNTDAYTLVGGYFNQGYYPSRCNMFTPAKTEENRINVPMLRLLGPDPLHNYDSKKYVSEEGKKLPVYTMECATNLEPNYTFVDWYYKNTFTTEDMGFSYTQIGQENSFGMFDITAFTKMRIEEAKKIEGVEFLTMGETGRAIKEKYGYKTPITANVALDNWDSVDLQCAYYNCENYVANLFRCENKLFIRALYLFDEKLPDHYIQKTCKTFDAVYENQPIVDTIRTKGNDLDNGWYIDFSAKPFDAKRKSETELSVFYGDKSVNFTEDGIEIIGNDLTFSLKGHMANAKAVGNEVLYNYNNRDFKIRVTEGDMTVDGDLVTVKQQKGRIKIGLFTEI